ncbi:hypothetical protein B0F90DRAFT_1725938 [Multifurca ochricompacta]|uniref:Uncharacterized protein n=1 Tax=Multifurca ochricompacta TaxID=376703 RepID=A0AAD4M3C8_9AGAM|nr:hypothetical protein B0F90DRAFT_1725938 [Multifurca ochricompacta]
MNLFITTALAWLTFFHSFPLVGFEPYTAWHSNFTISAAAPITGTLLKIVAASDSLSQFTLHVAPKLVPSFGALWTVDPTCRLHDRNWSCCKPR